MNARVELIMQALAAHGDFAQTAIGIRKRRFIFEIQYKKYLELKCGTMTILDEDYPDYFRRLANPPLVLFYYGDRRLFNYPYRLGVVGTRHPTSLGTFAIEHALNWTVYNCSLQAKDIAIVSGMAIGIDALAARKAMEYRQKVITVLGSGIDRPYPSCNQDIYDYSKDNGLILSEYPMDTAPTKRSFPIRNRIIAAMSPGIYMPEAKIQSGTYHTINDALEIGHDIATGPGRYDDDQSLNTMLLKEGAQLVTSGRELDEFFYQSLEVYEIGSC